MIFQAWVDTIKLLWGQLSGTSATEAKNSYLERMREWKYFGSTIFLCEVKFRWNFSENSLATLETQENLSCHQ